MLIGFGEMPRSYKAPIPVPVPERYPKFEDFEEIYRFIKGFRPRSDGARVLAQNPYTETTYEAYLDGLKIYEITRAISPRRTNILARDVSIDCEEKFAWMLFCKLKQKKETFRDARNES